MTNHDEREALLRDLKNWFDHEFIAPMPAEEWSDALLKRCKDWISAHGQQPGAGEPDWTLEDDAWWDATLAYEQAVPPHQKGFSEDIARLKAAILVLYKRGFMPPATPASAGVPIAWAAYDKTGKLMAVTPDEASAFMRMGGLGGRTVPLVADESRATGTPLAAAPPPPGGEGK